MIKAYNLLEGDKVKERNCQGTPYPVYPMPMAPIGFQDQMGYPMQYQNPMNYQSPMNYQGIMNNSNDLTNQVNNLEKRVTALENMVKNNYNSSNFQMM